MWFRITFTLIPPGCFFKHFTGAKPEKVCKGIENDFEKSKALNKKIKNENVKVMTGVVIIQKLIKIRSWQL